MARDPRPIQIGNVTLTTSQLEQLRTEMEGIPNGVNRCISGAINKTVAKGKTFAKKNLAAELTIKSKNLSRRIFANKSTAANLRGSVKLMGRAVGLINFKTVDTKKRGVVYQIFKSGKPETLRHAFIATGINKNPHVFQRKSDARLPIENMKSQRLYDHYMTLGIPPRLIEFMGKDFWVQTKSQIDRFLATKRIPGTDA